MLCTIALLVLCLMPAQHLPADPVPFADKIYHAVAFAGQAGCLAWGLQQMRRIPQIQIFFIAFIYTIFLGGFIEIFQHYFSQNRHGDWYDWLFDIIGAVMGAAVIAGLRFKQNAAEHDP